MVSSLTSFALGGLAPRAPLLEGAEVTIQGHVRVEELWEILPIVVVDPRDVNATPLDDIIVPQAGTEHESWHVFLVCIDNNI
jgi:hypothetical protein